ncbi:MAG: T9SS type A sorting domain-containing protein [Bacteroidota bacterium]
MTKTYCFWFKFCCLFNFVSAQQIENAIHWQSESLLSFQSIDFSANNTFIGGIFRVAIEQAGINIEAIGKNDVFLAQINENGEVVWLKAGGSSENDELVKIVHANNQIYTTGTYWVEGQFGDLQLKTKKGSKGIFLLNYNSQGNILWGISIDGTASKSISDLVVDHQGNLLLTGSFRDSLFLDERATLFSERQSSFLAKFDQNGNLLWTQKATVLEGNAESIALAVSEENEVVLTGDFIGQMQIESEIVETNTEDDNVFIARFSENGDFLWLRSAGGVFPDEVVDIQCTGDQIYLTGNYFGRLQMSEDITIESIGLNENIFLLIYNKNGEAIAAKNLGNVDLERVVSMDILGDQIVLGGFFEERMQIGDFVIQGNENELDGFVLNLDKNGNPLWLRALDSDNNLLVNEVHFRSPKDIQVIGDFIGNAKFDGFQFIASTFNPFFLNIKNPISSTTQSAQQLIDFQIIHHPEYLEISTSNHIQSLQIFDLQAKLLQTQYGTNRISTTLLHTGIYLLHFQTQNGQRASRLFGKLN